MYSRLLAAARAIPKVYSSFARENPNANAFIHSVASSVAVYYLTVAIIDDRSDQLIRALEADIESLKEMKKNDLRRMSELNTVLQRCEERQKDYYFSLHQCEKNLLEKKLRLDACKSDFHHAGLFSKIETFPESIERERSN